MGYELYNAGIYEVAAIAVKNLCAGVDALDGRELTAKQLDSLAKQIEVIEAAALKFRKLARVVVAKNATTTEENGNG